MSPIPQGIPHERRISLLCLTKYTELGPSSRYRIYQYLAYLRGQNIDVQVQALLPESYLQARFAGKKLSRRVLVHAFAERLVTLLRSRSDQLIWLEYELFPYLPAWFERLLVMSGRRYVVDYDDALFHQYDRHTNWFVRRLLGRKIATVMKHAEAVIVGNAYLADYAHNAGARRVELIPTVVDIDRYPVPTPAAADVRKQPAVIGWIGSPSTSAFLTAVATPLAEVCEATGADVHLIGSGPVELPGVPFRLIEWNEATEVDELQRLTIGIMPLPDTPWARGKCGLKLIQYMACGLPVVASSVGANVEIVEHGVNGFLASTADEWRRALTTLLNDPELRRRMGAAGRQKVERQYSLQVAAPKVMQIFKEASWRQ